MNASDWSISDVFKTMISRPEIPEEMARKSFKTCGILNALSCNDLSMLMLEQADNEIETNSASEEDNEPLDSWLDFRVLISSKLRLDVFS